VRNSVIPPKELTVLGPHPDHATSRQLHILPDTRRFGDDRRRISGTVAPSRPQLWNCRSPNFLARPLVERHHHGRAAAGSANQPVTVNQRRFAVTPARHHLARKVPREILAPNLAPCRHVRANQVASEPHSVNAVSVDRRRTVGMITAAKRERPEDRSILDVDCNQMFLAVVSTTKR